MISLHPALVLLSAAFILPWFRGRTFSLLSLLWPLATLYCIWSQPAPGMSWEFLDYTLELWQENPPTKVFATIFSLMAFAGALFALHRPLRLEVPAAFGYAAAAIGVTYSGDLISLFIWWELMAIGSTLVIWANRTQDAYKASRRYLHVHLVGGVVFMSGLIGHTLTQGSIELVNLSALEHPTSWLMLLGIMVNSGTPPLGAWLPDAYPEASPTGTVFLSAYTTKTTVFVLMLLFAGTPLLIIVGAIMSIYGIVYAILENDVRRILAYSIVNQVGFMVCAVGIGTPMALNGASAHAFAHIIYKALLLMSAGSVLHMTGKRLCTDVGGLYRTMPITMWCGIIGALAISAVPLTSGFTTKSMITDAAAYGHHTFAWFILVAASAGVFLHAGIKFPWFVFFQRDSGLRPPDPPWNMRLAMILLAGLCILIGIYPDPLYQILPYPAAPGEVLYKAYTASHVLSQLELLGFSGLAFFMLLPMLKRTLTITLDSDWVYRRLVPAVWEQSFAPALRLIEPLHRFVTGSLPGLAAKAVMVKPTPRRDQLGPVRTWTVGAAVFMVTLLLLVFLVLNLW